MYKIKAVKIKLNIKYGLASDKMFVKTVCLLLLWSYKRLLQTFIAYIFGVLPSFIEDREWNICEIIQMCVCKNNGIICFRNSRMVAN